VEGTPVKFVICGNMTKDEIAELLQKLRDIEQHDPKRIIAAQISLQSLTEREVVEIFRRINPSFAIHVGTVKDGEIEWEVK